MPGIAASRADRPTQAGAQLAARPDETASPWLAGDDRPRFEPLSGDVRIDAVVLGAGITGLLAARALQAEGLAVAVLEQRSIGAGATGHTTAKLSSLQGLRYSRLRSRRSAAVAEAYAAANEQGLERIRAIAAEGDIDCDLRERSNFVYAESGEQLGSLAAEAEAAGEAGLPVELVDEVPLPLETAGGLRLDGQAELHPIKFLDGVADAFVAAGGMIYERTRALGLSGSDPCRVETDRGLIVAPTVVLATHFPFADRGLLFARMHAERSYSLALGIDDPPPPGMFINASSPVRSIRSLRFGGEELLLIGGEGHKVGQGGPTRRRYETLLGFAGRHFAVRSIEFEWSTQDNIPIDWAPFIGQLAPRTPGIFVATGYAKWGLAMAASAGAMIADLAVGRENPLAEHFDPRRLPPLASITQLAQEGAEFSLRLVGDRLARGLAARAEQIAPGEGRIIRAGRRQLAVSRSAGGEISILSARCPHMGCIVAWNDAERSWDCPCHGSRFAADGELLQGPAVSDLGPSKP